MPKNIAIETAENQLGNARSQLWRHLVNTHGSPRYSAFGVRCWKIPPLNSWLSWARSLLLDCDVIGIGGSERNSRKASAAQLSVKGGACILSVTTAESHEYWPSDVTADFWHCQVGSRQFRSQYFSASKSSIKRAQIFFLDIFQNHRGITVSLDELCFKKWKFVEPRL